MIETIKNIAAAVGCVISIITLCGIIIKPMRKGLARWIQNIVGDSETSIIIKSVNDKLEEMSLKLDGLRDKIEIVDQRVFENERDRIKAELSSCAARCRRNTPLYPEEFMHIQEIYDKYSQELHCNHTGTEDYDYIRKYYESQDFTNCK